ncbi:MAG: EAL domain-containing protein [Burkholderiales bacterium]|nr:EAL domain-containing protein [Burkholderiales bacterium]
MNLLAQVIEALSLEMDFEKVCRRATQIAMEMIGADVSALALPAGADTLTYQYFWGLPEGADVESMSRPVGLGAARHVFGSGQPIHVPDYPNYQYAFPPFVKLGLDSGLAVPVMIGEDIAGVFSLGWLRPVAPPTEEQMALIEVIARQVGIAYHRMNLMREVSDSQVHTAALNERMSRVMAVSPAIIYSVTVDVSGPQPCLRNLLVGDSVESILGYSKEMLSAQPNVWYQLVHPEDLPQITLSNNLHVLAEGYFNRVYRMRHSAGHYFWVQDNIRLFPAGKNQYEAVGLIMDITERKAAEAELRQHRDHLEELVAEQTEDLRSAKNAAEQAMWEAKQAEEKLRHLAHIDGLTGLANRVLMTDRMRQAIAYAERHNQKLALLFIDLDRFKNINDSLGHSIGDRLLQEVAARLRDGVRQADTIGRQSGDEFIVLLSAIEQVEAVASIAENLITAIAQPYAIDGHELAVTLSMGISLYPTDGASPEDLIKKADTAMYKAKEAGRNNYQFFTQHMGDMARDRLTLENDLRRALERRELALYYQPQVDVATGDFIGMEALLRWRHPERGMLLPRDFIGVAEESGLIIPIGNWVLREACRQNRAWQAAGLPAIPVAVNISPLQFRRLGLLQEIGSLLEKTGLAPHLLSLELTEGVVMHHAEATIASLRGLKEMGVRLSIDDFGTGYSGLGYLKSFPIDALKIDQTFIDDLTDDASDAAIVRAIIGMGHSLGLKVIAEGVSNERQLARLRELRCDAVQGNHHSPPLEADAFSQLLAQHRCASASLNAAAR